MNAEELNAYIDESGDEGFKPGATEWFTVFGVIVTQSHDRHDREVASALGLDKSSLFVHFSPKFLWLFHSRLATINRP